MATTVRGIARNVRWETVATEERSVLAPRKQTEHHQHLQFRIEQVDDTGDPTGYTSVVASASSPEELPDFIADGDEVEVTGAGGDGPLEAHELTNLTTGATVTLKRTGGALGWIGKLVLVLAVVALIVYLFF